MSSIVGPGEDLAYFISRAMDLPCVAATAVKTVQVTAVRDDDREEKGPVLPEQNGPGGILDTETQLPDVHSRTSAGQGSFRHVPQSRLM